MREKRFKDYSDELQLHTEAALTWLKIIMVRFTFQRKGKEKESLDLCTRCLQNSSNYSKQMAYLSETTIPHRRSILC